MVAAFYLNIHFACVNGSHLAFTSQDYLKALLTFSIGNSFKPCTKSSKPDLLREGKGLDSPLQFSRQQFSLGQPFW